MKRWRISASFPPPSVHLTREGRLKEPPGGHIEQHDYLIILSLDFTHTKKKFNSSDVCLCVACMQQCVCGSAGTLKAFCFCCCFFYWRKGRQKKIVVALLASYSVCVCVSLSYIIFALSGRIGPFRNQFFFSNDDVYHIPHTRTCLTHLISCSTFK